MIHQTSYDVFAYGFLFFVMHRESCLPISSEKSFQGSKFGNKCAVTLNDLEWLHFTHNHEGF